MNDADFPVAKVLEGIEAAAAAGLGPVKINMVVKRGVNDDEHRADGRALARHRAHRALHRVHGRRQHQRLAHGRRDAFGRGRAAHLASAGRSSRSTPTTPAKSPSAGATSTARGEIGVISSVTQAFCSSCTRMRLSTEGSLYTCLFAQPGHDLKSLLRGGASDDELRNEIAAVWQRRADRYSEIRTARDGEGARKSRCPTSVAKRKKPVLTERRAAGDLRGRGLQRARRDGADLDRRRASAHALPRQARDRHADDARPRARGAGHRLPAQPAPGRLDRRHRRRAGRLGNRLGRRHHALEESRFEELGQEDRHHRLRPGHGVRRPDGGDRHRSSCATTCGSTTRTSSCCSRRCASTRPSTSRPARCTAARSPPPRARS